ncbi:Uma2 family endonuclease [Streptomyces sp. CB01881]|uniref:Uma2 family endonuclease n=1 Tax=Streptomyces sp. CB01881 TaxID=2078691 RepID=UPI000CDBFD5A|nr:Uma2 family endonuclease [Streptomyces sp. CB01881]AUY52197.1 Uma2 family endonuclease [Streptomyces sp. CB01881]TYC71624.1 Uma2 family endonuclease [Streptomyces sp. CB01881]
MTEFRGPERHARLLAYAQSLTPPSGWKIEVSGDEIIVMAGPSLIHQRNLLIVREQFDAHRPADLMPSENTDLASPTVGKLRNPDLTYLPLSAVELGGNEVPAELAAIAVEIVSVSNPENDLVGKVRDYPLMHIPLYLVIDPRDGGLTLHSEPDGGTYRRQWRGRFGDRVPVPDPFAFDLVTGDLIRYPAA